MLGVGNNLSQPKNAFATQSGGHYLTGLQAGNVAMKQSAQQAKTVIVNFFQQVSARTKPYRDLIKSKLARVDRYLLLRPRFRKWVIRLSYVGGPPWSVLMFILVAVWIETPSKRELRNIQNQVASEVYSADSVLLGRYFIQDRTEIKYESLKPEILDALVATEDVRFYEHAGIDYMSLGRVLVKSIFMQDESAGGGSTLTQQLAKNLYPRKRYWILSMFINKMREFIIARRLESVYSKQQLITLYLNTVPFGDNVFGIQAAARRFYSINAEKLTLDQAAVLIGMLKATYSYNPRLFPERSLDRRNVVLGQMVKYNYLDSVRADSLRAIPIKLKYNRVSHHEGLAPYFREYLKSQLEDWCNSHRKKNGSRYNLYTDGLKIYTTIDSRMQRYAEQAVTKQMTEVQQMFFDHWGRELPWKDKEFVVDEAIRRSARYKKLKDDGLSEKEIIASMNKPVAMKLFTWKGVQEKNVSPIDSIKHHLQYLNAGFIAMDAATGEIRAWVGGIDHDFFQFDHVRETTKRQVGSTFKPIVYAMAIEEGAEPCSLKSASRPTYIDDEGKPWTPRNSQNDYAVDYTMRGALAYSVNTIAAKLIQEAGVSNTIAMARRMGVDSDMPNVPSISLGSSSISLIEMTEAYACFANEGMHVEPFSIRAIVDLDGKVHEDLKPSTEPTRAMTREAALLTRNLLETVVHEGTASRIRWRYGVYTDVAGKTGTTQANADGWFMAFTPNLVIGSWVGADDPRIRFRSTLLGQGSSTALPITGYFLNQLNHDADFKAMTSERFPPLPADLRLKLDCDLYELSDDLWQEIAQSIFQRDSIINADTLAEPPKETFLQTLLKRKIKMMEAQQRRDSIAAQEQLEIEGG